ncbi:MAG: hypothetical protein H7A45_04315 [Verrucomicrobiales bacterium]|nr:hypothetical protein [Verrucomicrobiales bacterium]
MNPPKWLQKTRPNSLLGLAVRRDELAVVMVRRAGGECRVEKAFTLPLTTAQIEAAPEEAGQQLAVALKDHGLTEKRCVIRLPLAWAMAARIDVPDLAPADLQSFLELRAEREFAYLPGEAALAFRRSSSGAAARATLLAVAQRRVRAVERLVAAAGRKALSLSLGPGICPATAREFAGTALNICPTPAGLNLVVTAGEDLLAFRHLEVSHTAGEPAGPMSPDELVREIRLTCGRLPAEIREAVRTVRFHGPDGLVGGLHAACEPLLRNAGWPAVERAPHRAVPTPDGPLPLAGEGALEAACRFLAGDEVRFEFLLPEVSRAQVLLERFGKGRRRQTIMAVSTLAALLVVVTLVHQSRLASFEKRWKSMASQVNTLEQVQRNIRHFRPWFDNTVPTLRIVEQVTSAFPEEGSIWAKTFEIKAGSEVSCSGLARNNQVLLETLDRLRQVAGVTDLKVKQVRGENPIQFSFQFTWQNEPET